MDKSIAVLSNINIDPLKVNLTELGFNRVYISGFNQWQSELLDANSELYSNSYDYILLYLYVEQLSLESSAAREIIRCIRHYLSYQSQGQVLVCELAGNPSGTTTYIGDYTQLLALQNSQLHDFAREETRVGILPFSRLMYLYGYKELFDSKYWYLGRMRFSLSGYEKFAQEIYQYISAIEGQSAKVLVLDLDNTLWGGVAGEDGWDQLAISTEGKGLIYKEFQQLILRMKETGILLSICSKNNMEDAKEVFEKAKGMTLQWDDFVAPRINWASKDDNLRSISSELQLGLDSMVFIDDNPIERELIRKSIPEVKVPEFPADISKLTDWFLEEVVYRYFARTHITNEDSTKTEQYRLNKKRELEKESYSYDEFLQQLNMEVTLYDAKPTDLPRIAQLTQKTNQFNLSLKRYNEAEIHSMYEADNWRLMCCTYRDKFGDEGIVGALLVEMKGRLARIDNFLLSCRALGRKVEFAIMEQFLSALGSTADTVQANFVQGDKNIPAASFYTECGFLTTDSKNFELHLQRHGDRD